MALNVANSQCHDIEAASGKRGVAQKCIDYTTARFDELESLRQNSLMRGYIWGVCAEVSGYTTDLSPQAIGLFSICARVMMNRCNEGSGDGYQLDELSCNRAIRSMAWYGGIPQIKSPKR